MAKIHRVGERGPLGLGVLPHHQRDVEFVETLADEWDADHPGGVANEEGDLVRCGELSRHDQVAFVLAVLVVHHDDDLAGRNRRHSLGNGGEAVTGTVRVWFGCDRGWHSSSFRGRRGNRIGCPHRDPGEERGAARCTWQ
jgi:hypothetical protein